VRHAVRWSVKGLAVLAAVAALVAVLSLAVMLLWNSLVPELFRGPSLQYWQAFGLLVLSRILFGGLRGRGWHGHWRQRMWRERWESMTPEERARLREHFQQRCGRRSTAAGEQTASPPGA
jgi:hypothetical protein